MSKTKMINTILLLLMLILFITIISFSFAAFNTRISNSEKTSTLITKSGVMEITFEGGEHINAPDIVPSNDSFVTKTFTLTGVNSTEEIMNYHLIINMETNTFRDSGLAYTLSSNNINNNGKTIPSKTDITGIKSGTREIFLGNGYFEGTNIEDKVHSYSLKLYFPLIENFDHTVDQNKEFSAKIEIKEGEEYSGYNHEKGVNHPVLFTGMTPIKWDENNDEINTTSNDPDWYDYNEKRWANAKSQDGSYWVWIPRYAYKIETCYHTSGEDCYNLTGKEAGDIDVKFLKSTTNISEDNTTIETTGYEAHVKDTSMHHFLHPAFQFNGDELGFWVAKFEPSVSDHTSECYINPSIVNCNNMNNDVKIIPNATSWRFITLLNAFQVTLNMKNNISTYLWLESELNSHMMNNHEWGAVAYLSASEYGADGEVWNNSYIGYKTGCSGPSVNASSESTCVTYKTEDGQKASTTHNIYGVYDMSGGSYENVMAGYNNLIGDIQFPHIENIASIENKYITRYFTVEEKLFKGLGMDYDTSVYGDGIYETSFGAYRYGGGESTGNILGGWYTDRSYLPYITAPWFHRGGKENNGPNAGVFHFYRNGGSGNVYRTFRPILTPLS